MNQKLFAVDQMYLTNAPGPVKALASLKVAEVFMITRVKVVLGSKGLFVAMPQERIRGGEGAQDKYLDIVFPLTRETREQISALVLEAYRSKQQEPAKA